MSLFFKGFKIGMKNFGNHPGRVVNTSLLVLIYFLALGPTSIIAKLKKKRFLKLSLDNSAATYWENLDLKTKPQEKYYKQF